MIDHNIRKLSIGGSDVAALFGADDYKDAFAVWASKKGGLPAEPPNEHMIAGKILEPAVLALYERAAKCEVQYVDITYQHPVRPYQCYSPDATVVGERRGVEAKVVFWGQRSQWGFHPDDMPDRVLFQCWWYMSAMDYPQWDVAALVGEGLPRIYTVERLDAQHEAAMLKRAEEWWERYILGDEHPPLGNSEEAARWLAKTYPTHQRPDMREATAEETALLEKYVTLRLLQKGLDEERDGIEITLKEAIRDKEGISWDGNSFTWRRTKDREEVDWHSMALGLLHNYVKDENDRAGIQAQYTGTKDGIRKIYLNHPLFNRAKRHGIAAEVSA